jgi:Flp pilus assembly protein TadG
MNRLTGGWVPTYNRRERTMRTREKRYMREIVRTPGCQQGTSATRRGRRERGQSLVETAVVLPILLLLVAAVVDFGRAFDAYIVLTNAAREGARFGSVKPTLSEGEVKQIVVDDVLGSGTNITHMGGFTADNVTVEGQTATSEVVKVTVTYQFDLWFGRLVGIPRLTLTKEASMPRWFND